ncbi:diacylglycerol/lipid kinase family protein [Hippea sp. KM1]|uniref:diacylglycerol/lipid kinase family protein n=1 Tax=Hippea sp. KM1 TaxID=944481 RepID=UPI00046D1D23|nr:diacylglycerol kinase family protein [Hippea sp. KM1]
MIAIIANPNAHNFSSVQLKRIVSEIGGADVFFTQRAKDGTAIANRIASRYDTIAAYGGDGIVNEIINANLGKTRLAVLPAGTTNVLAIELFGSPSMDRGVRALKRGRSKKAYTGMINKQHFMLMAGLGFDAESVHSVSPKLKRISGKFAYFSAGVSAYLKGLLKKGCFEVELEGHKVSALWVIVSKIRKYAGNFTISDKVSPFVCLFDVVVCECKNRAVSLPYYNLAIFSGLHRIEPPFVRHIITKGPIVVRGDFKAQIDGDEFFSDSVVISPGKEIELIV